MTPDKRFVGLPKQFWAFVRLIGKGCGYASRGQITVPTREAVTGALSTLGLTVTALDAPLRNGTATWIVLHDYFTFRRDLLHGHVEPNLMDASQAKREFGRLKRKLKPTCPLPMNKQTGEKKAPAYLTGIVNMLIEANAQGNPCNYDPHALVTVAVNKSPLRTFARRMDGAFPSVINPVAVWEVKEYTTIQPHSEAA